ncbi:MAG: VIT1/CCC1 transporter family protein [Actinomycetota bacterium]
MTEKPDLERYRDNYHEEIDSAFIYRAVADSEQNAELAELFGRLAETEEAHARVWVDRLEAAGARVPAPRPRRRARILAWLARRYGPKLVIPSLAAQETAAQRVYDDQPEASATMSQQERSHARLLGTLANGGVQGSAIARMEGRHRSGGGNALRAAVLGANDGLVSNLSLVMGVAGANLANKTVLVAGIAGLLAGAGSMALGEWLSVQSSRELYEREIQIEAEELEAAPEEEEHELALIYQAKGLPEAQARELAARIIADPATALDTLAREELGIDPDELGGSPWTAAGTSFVLFSAGAVIPVIPFVFLSGTSAIAIALAGGAAGLFGIGAAITLFTGRSVLRSGLRSLAFGLAAAGLTYGIGRLIGMTINA